MRLVGCRDLLPVPFSDANIPPYAIISHTWFAKDEEVLLTDFQDASAEARVGYHKLQFCAKRALADGLQYFWIDTCCIDRSSEKEVTEALYSAFRWYRGAERCYAYLSDVSISDPDPSLRGSGLASRPEIVMESRWFRRGWTLVELLAPRQLDFFSSEGTWLGSRRTLETMISSGTGIPEAALRSKALNDFPIEQRISWAKGRETTLPPDAAYCLMGVLDVRIPINYEESQHDAMTRLMDEVHQAQSLAKIPHLANQIEYAAIDDKTFRVLVLSAGPSGSKLTARLETRSLFQTSGYTPISYVWGQEPAIHEMTVNAQPCKIQPNLFHALQRMRHPSKPIILWIDSLCIDQSNKAERAAQVKNMWKIFSNAECLWIWLGEDDLSSERAMELINKITVAQTIHHPMHWDPADLLALKQLLHRTWFRRVWVVQEVALAKDGQIWCGGTQVDLRALKDAVRKVRASMRLNEERNAISGSLWSSQLTMTEYDNWPAVKFLGVVDKLFLPQSDHLNRQRHMSLEQIVTTCTFCDMTDKRDAIYALLNLAAEPSNTDLSAIGAPEPNYDLTVVEVFKHFVKFACSTAGCLDIICRPWAPTVQVDRSKNWPVTSQANAAQPLALPTWICDRRHLPFGDPLLNNSIRLNGIALVGETTRQRYNAHGGTTVRMEHDMPLTLGVSSNKLSVQGYKLGTIRSISPRMSGAVIGHRSLELLISNSDCSDEDASETVWRCLCGDRDQFGKPAPASFRSAYLWACKSSMNTEMGEHQEQVQTHSPPDLDIEELLSQSSDQSTTDFLEVVRATVWNRRTFRIVLATGAFVTGLVPSNAAAGDTLCILRGCSVPVVIRKVPDSGGNWDWSLVGDCYAYGFMNGEVLNASIAQSTFTLI